MVPVKQKHGIAVLIVGVLIGLIGVILVLSQLAGGSDPSRADLLDLAAADRRGAITEREEGWVDAGDGQDELAGADLAPAVLEASPEPVFSLSALEERPFEKFSVQLPDGVRLVDSEFGGPSLRFGAGARGVEIDGGEAVDFGGSISVAAWIKLGRETHERTIFARGEGAAAPMYLIVTSSQHSKPGCVIFGGEGLEPSSVRSSSVKPVDDGEWHFVVGMHDQKEGKLRIYVDGVISKSANIKGTFPVCRGPLSVGAGDFAGEIYGLRIYNWPLHTKDMLRVYQQRQ